MSFDALIKFLDWAEEKNYMKTATVGGLRAAVNKVLRVLDDEEKNDLSEIDLGDAFQRFENSNIQTLNTTSLNTYKARTKKAIGEFLSYRRNPSSWKPSISQRSTKTKNKIHEGKVGLINHGTSPGDNSPSFLTNQYPLRDDIIVSIAGLPRDLKTHEAKRLSAFLLTLCEDYEPDK